MSIFKAYDIRGKYPKELDETKARAIGWAITQFIKRRKKTSGRLKIVVGRDVRLSSPALSKNLIKGLLEGGADVTNIGTVTTPMSYFACGFYKFDGSVMVTASHNPPEYNGFKICRAKAMALSESTGLKNIEKLATEMLQPPFIPPLLRGTRMKLNSPLVKGARGLLSSRLPGEIKRLDIKTDYIKFIRQSIKPVRKPLKVAVDFTNGSVGPIFREIFNHLPNLQIIPLCLEPDGRFPNHEPNPMKDENIRDIKRAIRKEKADLGVAFDGDGDRVIFLDENARRIPNDLITVLIAGEVLRSHKKESIVYDLRSSRIVKEQIEKLGGRPVRERVGHAFIKATMRQHNAAFGGELSGHYYYRDNYFADSALLTFVHLINIISRNNKPISGIIKPLRKYFHSGELNFTVADKDKKMQNAVQEFSDGQIDYLDGVTVEYDDWWFNLRPSNTEPLLRLNIEAATAHKLKSARRKIEKILRN
ncbi:MAG: phosphomannomutase/phosphoglucomutase [Planctomycetota bacterium]